MGGGGPDENLAALAAVPLVRAAQSSCRELSPAIQHMKPRPKRRLVAKRPPLRGEFPRLRLRWLDRLAAVVVEMPGPPPASRINRTCSKLLDEIESYREGFVHALNVMRWRE
jgi:hypothetical protein